MEAQTQHCDALKALAHLDRLRTFFYLVEAREERHVSAIQKALRLPAATTSRHLDHLTRSGLLLRRTETRFVYYRTNHNTIADLVRLLTACC